jgi:hypothetical protein
MIRVIHIEQYREYKTRDARIRYSTTTAHYDEDFPIKIVLNNGKSYWLHVVRNNPKLSLIRRR